MVTAAPGTTAPEESFTTPRIVPVGSCADAEIANKTPRLLGARGPLCRVDAAKRHHDIAVLSRGLGHFLVGKAPEAASAFRINRKNHAADVALAIIARDLRHRQLGLFLTEIGAQRLALLDLFGIGKLEENPFAVFIHRNSTRNRYIDWYYFRAQKFRGQFDETTDLIFVLRIYALQAFLISFVCTIDPV